MRTTRHSLMAKGILVLLSLMILVFALTYSWYLDPATPVEATGISFSTRNTSTDFEYAVGFSNSQTGGEYKHTTFTNTVNADLNLEELYADGDTHDAAHRVNLLYDYNPIDLTGNGVTLVRPAMNYGNWEINPASRNYSIAEENVQFISFDLIFRTHVQSTTICLDAGSFAKGACENYSGDGRLVGAASGSSGSDLNYNDLTNDSVPTSNKYGRFSRDAIVGAVRVAFLEYEANSGKSITPANIDSKDLVAEGIAHYAETPVLLWIPRPDLFLNNGAENLSDTDEDKKVDPGSWTLDTNVTDTDKLLVTTAQKTSTYRTYQHQYYNVFQVEQSVTPGIVTYDDAVASVLNTSAPANTDKVTFGRKQEIVALDCYDDVNDNDTVDAADYFYGKVRVRIWLEGTDSESRRALAGGKFNVSFHITG